MLITILPPLGALAAILFAILLSLRILKKSEGTDRMKEISRHIREGAKAYLGRQYLIVAIFFAIVFILLMGKSIFIDSASRLGSNAYYIPFSFLSGGLFSALAGYFGMKIATNANSRTTWATKTSLNDGLRVAFNSGTVMGMLVVGLGLLHLSLWYFSLKALNVDMKIITDILVSSGLGASSMALFARVGGGIFTKAADVGADLVGKVEAGIPEDDPRNPATIADNVGDNVGDVAGMGADLYESYIGSIVATMAIAAVAFGTKDMLFIVSPLILAAIGVFASIVGTFFVRTGGSSETKSLLWALRKGIYLSSVLVVIGAFVFVNFGLKPMGWGGIGIFWAVIIGLVAGNIIGYFTEYFTSYEYKPTRTLSEQAKTGPATIIIAGLSLGLKSTVIPVLTIILGIAGAFYAAGGGTSFDYGLFGIGMAAIGMLSTLGITLATDAYGPVADNAGGIAEMSDLPPEVRERTDSLDALGNTTAATGKGFAIGSAALTALALLAAYTQGIHVKAIDLSITDPTILIGLFIGAMLPFYFSAMTMSAVGRAAGAMVEEVRRQFREIPGIMEGTGKPDYAACVSISTAGAQREMFGPALLAILAPILTGIVFGVPTVVALLAGALVSGFSLAIMMANAGGAWDNAKKYIEHGALGGKGSDNHKAAVVGDTVGDPFKDTSGPSINILLKLMAMVAIISASAVITFHDYFKSIFS